MANPRQRSKARSHKSHGPSANAKRRLHHKLRKAPALKGPEVLQHSWDKKKTVFQNYAALGLLPSIPIPQTASSSRSQRVKLDLPSEATATTKADAVAVTGTGRASASKKEPAGVKSSFGRIIRDENGNVVDIILDEDEDEDEDVDDENDGGNGMEVDHDDDDEEEEKKPKTVEAKTDVVRKLEAISATAAPVIRHSSTSERTWLQSLVDKYGDDTESMARDSKLNVWQKTQGEIKRAIKKAGGASKLRN